jgi:hypothetical protein
VAGEQMTKRQRGAERHLLSIFSLRHRAHFLNAPNDRPHCALGDAMSEVELTLHHAKIVSQPMVTNFSTGGGHGSGHILIEGDGKIVTRKWQGYPPVDLAVIGKPHTPLREVVEPRYRGTAQFATRARAMARISIRHAVSGPVERLSGFVWIDEWLQARPPMAMFRTNRPPLDQRESGPLRPNPGRAPHRPNSPPTSQIGRSCATLFPSLAARYSTSPCRAQDRAHESFSNPRALRRHRTRSVSSIGLSR